MVIAECDYCGKEEIARKFNHIFRLPLEWVIAFDETQNTDAGDRVCCEDEKCRENMTEEHK